MAPIYLNLGIELNPSPGIMRDSASIALEFGVVMCFRGVLGVACGALLAKRLRIVPSIGRTADPLVSAFGMFLAIPSTFIAFFIPYILANYLLHDDSHW